MKTKPHPYFERATYLLIISGLLGIAELFFDNKIIEYNIITQSITIVLTLLLMIFIIYSVWQEKFWTKFVLPIFAIIGIIDTISSIKNFSANPIYLGIDILSSIIFIAATVYVLMAPKKAKEVSQ
ncbi:MAG TPA: hypothetical protein VHP12_08510 [Chitinophagaceae bacterium]|nr:hypothetical protein [Chitinophagaceae bacterium]